METTQGTLLGGRIRYAQPVDGYRTGIEPVLLAASVPAQAGELVIEAGVGAGAGLMCLAARVPGIVGIGIEIDPAMAELARANIAANEFVGLTIVTGDITEIALPMADHVMANPPWHDPRSTASPVGRRRLAKQESGQGIEAWIAALAPALRDGGSLTMIVPPALVRRWRAACVAAGLAGLLQHALVPKVGREAKLLLLRAFRAAGEASDDKPETVLHQANGAFTDEIEAVLRHGAALAAYGGANSRLPGP